jgi:hypothetical protein
MRVLRTGPVTSHAAAGRAPQPRAQRIWRKDVRPFAAAPGAPAINNQDEAGQLRQVVFLRLEPPLHTEAASVRASAKPRVSDNPALGCCLGLKPSHSFHFAVSAYDLDIESIADRFLDDCVGRHGLSVGASTARCERSQVETLRRWQAPWWNRGEARLPSLIPVFSRYCLVAHQQACAGGDIQPPVRQGRGQPGGTLCDVHGGGLRAPHLATFGHPSLSLRPQTHRGRGQTR